MAEDFKGVAIVTQELLGSEMSKLLMRFMIFKLCSIFVSWYDFPKRLSDKSWAKTIALEGMTAMFFCGDFGVCLRGDE